MQANGATRVPPQAPDAETSVLGAILRDNAAMDRVMEILGDRSDDVFYRPGNQHIFDAMRGLADKGDPVDILTMNAALEQAGMLEQVGGVQYLTSLVEGVISASNVNYHAEILRGKAILRRLVRAGTDIAQTAYDGQEEPEAILDEAQAQLFEIAKTKDSTLAIPVNTLLAGTLKELEERQERKTEFTGIKTGLVDFDRMTAGLQKGDLVILAARPSMGKTALALNIAQNAAIDDGIGVAIFSLEMSKEALTLRLLASEARVDSARIRTGNLHEDDWSNITQAVGLLNEARVYIDDSSGLTPLELRSRSRLLKSRYDIGLIVVDYLQLMDAPSRYENRQQAISYISRSLKGLAKELEVPVVALSQLNRAVESRAGDKRPQLSDLRESGAIEQDADLVCFIHRPEMYSPEVGDLQGRAELIIGKQRNGPVGKVELTFTKAYTRFENYIPDTQVPPFGP